MIINKKFNKETIDKLKSYGFKMEYNIMKKSYGQILLVLDFADREIGVCKVEVKDFYLEFEKFEEISNEIGHQVAILKLEGLIK